MRKPEMDFKIRVLGEKLARFQSWVFDNVCKVGKEDPRRVIHALKVGLSLTLVSLLYLMEPLSHGVGENAIWAVMTVVVVLEFTAGATLGKGLNRGLGTLLAGTLAFLFNYIANKCGQTIRAVFIGAAVFIVGFASTYMRFFPYIKKNYDYGVVMFLLTFNLIIASSYRVENVGKIAVVRFYTFAIGCAICLFMSLLIFPTWSSEDLHKSIVGELQGLANSIDACVDKYFNDRIKEESSSKQELEDPICRGYTTVLDSKCTDETLALYASWEPRHCHIFPWQQYVKLGAVIRQMGYTVVALHGCLQAEIQSPESVRIVFKDPCTRLAKEVTKVLLELATSINDRQHCHPEILSDHLHEALQDLNKAIKSQPRLFLGSNHDEATLAAAEVQQKQPKALGATLASVKADASKRASDQSKENERKVLRPPLGKIAITSLEFSEALPLAAFASLLVDLVAKLDNVIEKVEELGRIASFKEFNPGEDEVIDVTCDEKPKIIVTPNYCPSHGPRLINWL